MLLLLVPRYYPNIVYIEISHELPIVRIPPRESVSVRTCVRTCVRLVMLSARSLLQVHAVCLIFFRIRFTHLNHRFSAHASLLSNNNSTGPRLLTEKMTDVATTLLTTACTSSPSMPGAI